MPPSNQSEALPEELAAAIDAVSDRLGRLGRRIVFFSSIGSTNDVATTLAAAGDAEGVVVIADAQTEGRGRRGRTWFSPAAAGLYISVVLVPAGARRDAQRATSLLTLMAGVALAEAVEAATGLTASIKWPNDLVIGRRKLAGILAEGVTRSPATELQSVVLGCGINVGVASYPPELADRATSLETELGRPVARATLCAETLVALARRYDDLLDARFDAILDPWRRRAPGSRGARVSWDTPRGTQTGTTLDVDDMGALLVRVGDATERLLAGEVVWA